jgi:hypothetical protein
MVLAGVENMPIALIGSRTHDNYYIANHCIIQAKPRFSSPLLQQGAFQRTW